MQKVKVVSGYVPLDGVINVSEEQFRKLGELLIEALERTPCNYRVFDDPEKDRIDTCWMRKWFNELPYDVVSTDPFPDPARFSRPAAKVWSNIVMHQKMEWMALAALEDPYPTVFIWIDYGVLKQGGMNQQMITAFIRRVERKEVIDEITAPGIRSTIEAPDPAQSWDRFCGSVVIVPRIYLFQLHRVMKRFAMEFVEKTHQVTIESNTLAEVERSFLLPFHWYQAWWGRSMFESYR